MNNTQPDADMEIEMTYKGVIYTIGIDYDTIEIDDSFNGDKNGGFYVFESSHEEIDKNSINVVYIESDEDYAIKPYDISDEFYKEIVSEVMSRDITF